MNELEKIKILATANMKIAGVPALHTTLEQLLIDEKYEELNVMNQVYENEKGGRVEAEVKPDACGGWQKEKPNKPCYFVHRYNRKDNKPSLFEAVIDGGVLVVANIQDDEFVETMEDFSDGDFLIIEKY